MPPPERPPGMAPEEPPIAPAGVRGERAAALVNAAQSVQARASSILAAGLMIVLGGAALTWYYAHALTRPVRARQNAQMSAASRAQGEMPLPALGPIETSRRVEGRPQRRSRCRRRPSMKPLDTSMRSMPSRRPRNLPPISPASGACPERCSRAALHPLWSVPQRVDRPERAPSPRAWASQAPHRARTPQLPKGCPLCSPRL